MYEELKAKFERQYGRRAEYIFSAPGRTELGGNHTDHQHGLVLAAAVTLDTKAAAAEIMMTASASYPRATRRSR